MADLARRTVLSTGRMPTHRLIAVFVLFQFFRCVSASRELFDEFALRVSGLVRRGVGP